MSVCPSLCLMSDEKTRLCSQSQLPERKAANTNEVAGWCTHSITSEVLAQITARRSTANLGSSFRRKKEKKNPIEIIFPMFNFLQVFFFFFAVYYSEPGSLQIHLKWLITAAFNGLTSKSPPYYGVMFRWQNFRWILVWWKWFIVMNVNYPLPRWCRQRWVESRILSTLYPSEARVNFYSEPLLSSYMKGLSRRPGRAAPV